ncbi:Ig-like domain-containing protein, partial [Myxococcota bacterium]
MYVRHATWSLCAGFFALSACHFGDPLEVLHASPTGELEAVPQWIEVRFDKPIVDPDATEPKAQGVEIRINPPVAGEVGFPTPSSLTFTFADALPPAQAYTVTLESGLRSFDGKAVLKSDYAFSFTSERNKPTALYRLEKVEPDEQIPVSGERRVKNLDLNESLLITFRFPEKVEQLKQIVEVFGEPMAGGDSRPLSTKFAFPAHDTADRLLISPDGTWPKHTRLEVRVAKGLKVAGIPAGPLASDSPRTLKAATYGPIEVVRGPECEMCRPPSTLIFEFSTPVDCDDVLPRVRVRPAPDNLKCAGQPAPTIVRIEPLPALSPYTKYKVNVRPGVVDKFGQELNERTRFEFETGDANPRFAHQLMFNVLERKLSATHEEKVYRTPKLRVEGARLPFNQAWKVIASEGLASQVPWTQLPWWLSDDSGYGHHDYD